MELSHQYIDSLAPNGLAASNGKLLAKSKFKDLCISEDESVLFGECSGSGKNPYVCSVDFLDKDNPISRCSCPSRQIPCKHSLGLMYAYADGNNFTAAPIPEDILSKRSKIEKRAENKEKKIQEAKEHIKSVNENSKSENEQSKPPKAKIAAAVKKMNAQLEGIELAEKLLRNMLQMGIAGMDSQAVKAFSNQIKELGNYYINGIQTAFNEVLLNVSGNTSAHYKNTISSLLYVSSLLKKAKAHLTEKIENPEKALNLDAESEIEEQIGHVWKLNELMLYEKYIENAKLIQLAFYSYDNESRKEFVDEGYYIALDNGSIYKTKNYRPYKAVKYIKEDDSIYGIVGVPELYIYPGGLNQRVRWERYNVSEINNDVIDKDNKDSKDKIDNINKNRELCKLIVMYAKDNYAETAKIVKNQIKNPLSDKNPMILLKVSGIILTKKADDSGDEEAYLEIIDSYGNKQILSDEGYIDLKTTPLIKNLNKELLSDTALLVMYYNNIETGILSAKPISIITENEIVRLLY